eukprot:479729_1
MSCEIPSFNKRNNQADVDGVDLKARFSLYIVVLASLAVYVHCSAVYVHYLDPQNDALSIHPYDPYICLSRSTTIAFCFILIDKTIFWIHICASLHRNRSLFASYGSTNPSF